MRNRVRKVNAPQEKSESLKLKPVDLSYWEYEFVEIPPSKEDTERLHQIHKLQSMKVDDKYVRETIDKHNKSVGHINEDAQNYATVEKNGATYYVVGMTKDEFRKYIKSVNMDDIQWTI